MNYINQPGDKSIVREGDICVIYISEHQKLIFKIKTGDQIQTKFGHLKAIDLIGQPYGKQFECKKGWILPLRLTPEIWTQLVTHRTQILYQADISLILLYLDIKPGSVVVESGTGSGSMSHSILRACLPNGFLHTFEINESRAKEASKEFIEHGYGDNVKVYNHDVCQSGFSDELVGKVDACMLDLPHTWDAIEAAYKVMKDHGSKICTFSPCVEQVQKNVVKMNELKLKDIVTYECLMRPLEIREHNLRLWQDDILDKLVDVDKQRIDMIRENFDATKRFRPDKSDWKSKAKDRQDKIGNGQEAADLLEQALSNPKAPFNANMLPKWNHVTAFKPKESVSHSGYLTFATKFVPIK